MRQARRYAAGWFVAAVWIGAVPVGAQINGGQPPRATGMPIDESPVIDGRLEEAAWGAAERLTGFVQNEPFEGRPATERTEIMVLFERLP